MRKNPFSLKKSNFSLSNMTPLIAVSSYLDLKLYIFQENIEYQDRRCTK